MTKPFDDATDMENKAYGESVRRFYELVDAGRVAECLAFFQDDVVYERQGIAEIRGMAAMRRFYEHDRVIAAGRHSIDQVLVDGSWVAVRGRFEGTLKNGSEVRFRFTDWHRFRGDRIDRRETFFLTT